LDLHRQAGVAGIDPIAMPARSRAHVDRELDLAAGRRRPFRDQLRLDAARGRERGHEQQRKEDEEPAEHWFAVPVMAAAVQSKFGRSQRSACSVETPRRPAYSSSWSRPIRATPKYRLSRWPK